MKKTGHDLLVELESHVDRIKGDTDSRHEVVDARLTELEDEKHVLGIVSKRIQALRTP